MSEEMRRANLIITGIVQGVFYRASTLEMAQSLSIKGWVCNLPEGGVEIEAEGTQGALEQLADWCQEGPPSADVKTIDIRWMDYRGEFETFKITR
jgi:acylphosphatase